ncbi:hypothetical protein, conserved [Angomonas deanei]|uniref:Uncharacterized protein n=1 Tax=Angomonas deanei TaxID=59799 RepID=A0A7G2C2R9_9TRYP|nr:hypothetical protein, conserved [Angomonas deanei]
MSDTLHNAPADATSVEAKSLDPLTGNPNYVTETFDGTLARLGEPSVNSKFGVPRWVLNLVETTKVKAKLVVKKEDFSDEDKGIIVRIFNVIQTQTGIERLSQRDDLEKRSPSYFASTWSEVKRDNNNITDGRALMAEFLRRSVSLNSIDPNNNALICCAAMLLDLSCTVDEPCFCDYVRRFFYDDTGKRFGCCLITNAHEELKHQSGDFVDETADEIEQIKDWTVGELARSTNTLSIGGESGSGKTRAALQCANFYSVGVGGVREEDVLTVYIKLSETIVKHWNTDVENTDATTRNAAKAMQRMYEKNDGVYKYLYETYQSNAFLEECIRNSTTEKNDLRYLRAAQCHDWLCKIIKESVCFVNGLKSKNKFKAAFVVLDEIAVCPWIYKAVNGNSIDLDYISKFFKDDTSFTEKLRFVCATTATESIFREMCSSPGDFHAVTMKPSFGLYNKLLEKKVRNEVIRNLLRPLKDHEFFNNLVKNRRCSVLMVNRICVFTPFINPVTNSAVAMNNCQEERRAHKTKKNLPAILFNLSEVENVYAWAGFLVAEVAAKYKSMNGTAEMEAPLAEEIVAKGIRAFLCCEEKDFEKVFSGFPRNPLKLGLFDCRTDPRGGAKREVVISVSTAQQVMAATTYGSGTIFATNITGGAFEVFSASIFSLYLSGYSTDCAEKVDSEKKIKGLPPANLSTFLNSVSKVKVKDTYHNPLAHPSVKGVLFASHRVAVSESLGSYLSVLAQFHRCTDKDASKDQAFVLVNARNAPYADLVAKSGDILFLVQCKSSVDIPKFTIEKELRKMGFSDKDDVEIEALVDALFQGDVVDEEKLETAIKIINSKEGIFRQKFQKCLTEICGKNEQVTADTGEQLEAESVANAQHAGVQPAVQNEVIEGAGGRADGVCADPESGHSEGENGGEATTTTAGEDADAADKQEEADAEAALLKGKLLTGLLMRSLGCTIAVPVFMCTAKGTDEAKQKLGEAVQNCSVDSFGWNDPAALIFVGGGIERTVEIDDSPTALPEIDNTDKGKTPSSSLGKRERELAVDDSPQKRLKP